MELVQPLTCRKYYYYQLRFPILSPRPVNDVTVILDLCHCYGGILDP